MKQSLIIFVKMIVFFISIVICQSINAQIYSSEECYYIEAGESLGDKTGAYVVLFDGNNVYTYYQQISFIKRELKQDPSYYRNNLKNISGGKKFSYNSRLSNYKREVYSVKGRSNFGKFYANRTWEYSDFLAFSKDKSEFIKWLEIEDEGQSGKSYYVKIDKNALLPKAANYDFLYE